MVDLYEEYAQVGVASLEYIERIKKVHETLACEYLSTPAIASLFGLASLSTLAGLLIADSGGNNVESKLAGCATGVISFFIGAPIIGLVCEKKRTKKLCRENKVDYCVYRHFERFADNWRVRREAERKEESRRE